MIPLRLTISGFLSYRDPVELDFSTFDLACIAGANGSGKSSLLDAITWSLFGQARKRDDSLINTSCETAEVSLIFQYEGNVYRVQRYKSRNKTTVLEFHILQNQAMELVAEGQNNANAIPRAPFPIYQSGSWKPLTERTLRETEARIEEILRLDYETFINASFFLQGKADQFTQQRPGDRKRILSSILGLETWETYRQRAADHRRVVEVEITGLDGRLKEINNELDEEDERKQRLKQLSKDLERLTKERESQAEVLANVRQILATLEEQTKLVDTLARQLEISEKQLESLNVRAESRKIEKDAYQALLDRSAEIEAGYDEWQKAQVELERWEEIANNFRESEMRRQIPLGEIQTERARLEQERKSLEEQQGSMRALQHEIDALQPQIENTETELAFANVKLDRRERLKTDLQNTLLQSKEIEEENKRLRESMNELKTRIDRLNEIEGAVCPTCGRVLNSPERHALIEQLSGEGTELGDCYRENQDSLEEARQKIADLEEGVEDLAKADSEVRHLDQNLAKLTSRLEHFQGQLRAWEANGAPRLEAVLRTLAEESFAKEARQQLAEIEAELKAIGYNTVEHDTVRAAVARGRESEEEMRALEKARAALGPLEREMDELDTQINELKINIANSKKVYNQAAESLAEAQSKAPDLHQAQAAFMELQEQENRLRMEVGAARQKVDVLDDLKVRYKALEAEREQRASLVGQYKQLERAFSKDGVPALLIEQALPQIESKANDILERLSAGTMTVRFVTQAAYKDTRREDLRETLDIQISDSAGVRDYEMYSGGEAFRVNFAIRLALSEVLAQRAGARLQTLVVDEGFGSQDALGRQRLIEAINLVRPDFAKILVITHIEELKDAFPTRIEVEKTENGSSVKVI